MKRFLDLSLRYKSFILYSVIGASGALLDFVSFLILFNSLGLNPLIANIISTTAGITNNFFLNRRFNFKSTDFALLRFLSFYATGIIGILLSTAIIQIFHGFYDNNANTVKLFSIIFVVMVQYTLNKKFSFGTIKTSEKNSLAAIKAFVRAHLAEIISIVLLFVMFFSTSIYQLSFDSTDNLLGARLILHGEIPYRDFFSHHMPGMYYLSVPLYLLSGPNVFAYYMLFNALVFVWTIVNFLLLRKYGNNISALVYVVLTALSHTVLRQHWPLGETVVLYAASSVLILLLLKPLTIRNVKHVSKQEVALLSFLLFLIPFFSLSYIYFAALLYVLVLYKFWPGSVTKALRLVYVLAAPYIAYAFYLLITNSLQEFVFGNLTFNSKYYSPFFGEIGRNPFAVAISIVTTSLEQINSVIINNLAGNNIVQFVTLLGYFATPLVLWLLRMRFLAVVLAVSVTVLNTRIGLYGGPIIKDGFNSSGYSQHGILYYGIAILFFCISLSYLSKQPFQKSINQLRLNIPVKIFTMAYLVIMTSSMLAANGQILRELYVKGPANVSVLAKSKEGAPQHIRAINKIAGSDDTAWVGPGDFYGQLFLKPERATKYTFFYPWHLTCTECLTQFMQELKEEKPVAIYMSHTFKSHPSATGVVDVSANTSIKGEYLDAEYFQINSDGRLSGLYFPTDRREEIELRLKENGYAIY